MTSATPTTRWCIVVSDNGASSEGGKEGTINEGRLSNFEGAGVGEMYDRLDEIGGPLSHNNYPWGWTMAGNTPFKRWKREVHEGGVADPCIVRLPPGRRATPGGGVRRQYAHAIDITPTVLELAGLAPPAEIDGIAQSHLDGTSFAYVLGDGGETRARAPRDAALRDARLARHLPRRLEGGDVPPGRPHLRRRPAVQRALGRGRVGALPRGRGRLGVPRPRPRSSPRRSPSSSTSGGRRHGATTCSRSTTGSSTPLRTSTTTAGPRRSTATSRTARRCPSGWPSTRATAPTPSRSPSRCPTASRPRARCSPSGAHWEGGRCT